MTRPRVCFQMIVFNSDHVLRECLEAVLPYGPVIATEGPVEFYQRLGFATSVDSTNAILQEYAIPTLHGQWREKDEMVNAGLERIPEDTNWIWSLDADEIWRGEDIERILRILASDEVDSLAFRVWSFYGGFERVMGGFEEQTPWYRIQRWGPGARWATHRPPTVLAPDGQPWRKHRHMTPEQTSALGLRFWHYSYVWPEQMRAKAAYYHHYDSRSTIPGYFQSVYLPWVLGDEDAKQAVEDRYDGVHNWLPERRGACRTRPAPVLHPESVVTAMPRLRARFARELEQYARHRHDL